jgi:hypothetical protein
VDESVWAVQLVEHAGKKVMEEAREEHAATQAGWPRPDGVPYK